MERYVKMFAGFLLALVGLSIVNRQSELMALEEKANDAE